MKKNMKKLIIVALVFMAFFATVQVSAAVSWPGFNSSKPIKAYTISTGNNTIAYTDANLNKKTGTIYASDELYIQSIARNSAGKWYCKLTYPTSRGRKTGYVALSVVTNATAPSEKYTAKAGITTYRRASSSAKAGSIAKGDTVYKLTTSGSYVQVLYNTGSASNPSGWRMAWITSSNFNKYINNSSTGYNPQGWVDSVTSTSNGKITVKGWAFDRDNLSSKLAIHVYVGGPAGSGAPCYGITANTSRPDVNDVHKGVGNYHGFNRTISVSKTGTQTVYIYAINVGAGTNVLIGTKTVTIKSNTITSQFVDVTSQFAGKKITIKSVENGKYLCADGNVSNTPAVCNRTSASTWETFTVSNLTSDGWVGIKAYNGKWLCANKSVTNAPLQAISSKLQSWECFRIYQKGNDYYIKAQANQKYLCVRVDTTNSPVQAYVSNASTWERFSIAFVNSGSTTVSLNVPLYKQNDARWAKVKIGSKTIGAIGCTTTCISMVYSYHTGQTVYPNAMKEKLSYSNNDLYWSSLKNVGLSSTSYNCGVTQEMLANIYNKLKAGRPVIIGATTSSGGSQHWVVITGYKGNSTTNFSATDFIVNDPGSANSTTLAQFLTSKNRTVIKRIIF